MTNKPKPQRLLALDILRGITIAGMLLVNNPGSWGAIYTPLEHAEWNGLTPTDLVFPFFMFIMGISTYFSLRKYDFELSWPAALKIIRRTVVIFAIGIFIAWFSRVMYKAVGGDREVWDVMTDFSTIRFLGVMPRLALCYGIGSLLALCLKRKALQVSVAAFLVLYAIVLLVGHGYEFSEHNIIYIVDNALLGPDHLYSDTVGGVTLSLDPEGLVSTLPSIAHMLIGFLCGGMLVANKTDVFKQITNLFIIGTILTFSGFLLSYGLPINKKVWSPTFVLTTCGLASSFLGLLIWIIDIKGHKTWCRFFEAYGINPLFMYVFGGLYGICLGAIKVPCACVESGVTSIKGWLMNCVFNPISFDIPELASLFYALFFVVTTWCVGYILYKNKIYIKI